MIMSYLLSHISSLPLFLSIIYRESNDLEWLSLIYACFLIFLNLLIDCGATQNFISVKLVKELRLEVTPTSPYFVEVGDGHKVRCQECVDPCLLNCKIYSSHRIVT